MFANYFGRWVRYTVTTLVSAVHRNNLSTADEFPRAADVVVIVANGNDEDSYVRSIRARRIVVGGPGCAASAAARLHRRPDDANR